MSLYDYSDDYFKNFQRGRSGPRSNPLYNPNLKILGEKPINYFQRMGPTILKEGAKKAVAGPAGPVGAFTTGLAVGDLLNTATEAATGKDISERIADRVYEMSGMQAQEEAMGRPLIRPLDPKTGYPVGYEAPTMSAMTPREFDIAKQNQVPAMQTEPQSTLGTDTAFMGTPTYGSTQGRPADAISDAFRDPSFKENLSMTERGLGVGAENFMKNIFNTAIDVLQESTGTNVLQGLRADPSVSRERAVEERINPTEFQPGEYVPTVDEDVTDISKFLLGKGREMPVVETSPLPMPVVKGTEGEKFDGTSEVKPSPSRAVEAVGFQPQFPGQKFEGQTISQYMRGEDTPESRTFQALDPQGRLRQFQAPGVLAEQYAPFEREAAAREARLEARGPMVGGPETAVRSGDALGGQISLNEARRIVDPQGKMSTPARTAAAQEYIRQEEIKTQDRARKDIDRQNEERMNELRIEGQRLQNEIRQKQLDDPKFDENVYSRNLTQKVADIAEKFRNNPSYEPSADERKTIFEYDAYRVGKLGASGVAYSPFLDQFDAPEFTEKQEADIKKVMDGNNISREKAISAMKAAGKL
jgi:hypothetical protein